MPKLHFKLVDTHIVSDHHRKQDLLDETIAQIDAIKLARSLPATRPQLVGRYCSIMVVDETGKSVCRIRSTASKVTYTRGTRREWIREDLKSPGTPFAGP